MIGVAFPQYVRNSDADHWSGHPDRGRLWLVRSQETVRSVSRDGAKGHFSDVGSAVRSMR
jgi:hypothetical protein